MTPQTKALFLGLLILRYQALAADPALNNPMYNRPLDPPPVTTITNINGTKTRVQIYFYPYRMDVKVTQPPLAQLAVLRPESFRSGKSGESYSRRVRGFSRPDEHDFDPEFWPEPDNDPWPEPPLPEPDSFDDPILDLPLPDPDFPSLNDGFSDFDDNSFTVNFP